MRFLFLFVTLVSLAVALLIREALNAQRDASATPRLGVGRSLARAFPQSGDGVTTSGAAMVAGGNGGAGGHSVTGASLSTQEALALYVRLQPRGDHSERPSPTCFSR